MTSENEKLKEAVVESIKERATWLYLLLDEHQKEYGEESKIKEHDFAYRAIKRFGHIKAEKMGEISTPAQWAEKLITPIGKITFSQEIIEKDDQKAVVQFYKCPLVEAWKELNLSDEEVSLLCKMARTGDFGRVEPFGLNLEFEKLISEGDDCCRLVIT